MPIRIDLPDGTIGEFPDGMSDREIERVLQRQYGYTGPEKSDVGQQIIGNLGAILGDPKPSPYRAAAPTIQQKEIPTARKIETPRQQQVRNATNMAGSVFAEPLPSRTLGELASDTYARGRAGVRSVAGGLVELANTPQHAINLVNTAANGYAQMLGIDGRIPMLPSYDWVRGTQAELGRESEQILGERTPAALRQSAEFGMVDGIAPTLGYLSTNPGELAGTLAEQAPQFLAAGLPGGVGVKLAGAGAFAGGQTASQVAEENQRRVARGELTQAQADALTAQAAAGSAAVNTVLPRMIPGGTVLEEAMAGARGTLTRGRGAALGLLGEGITGFGEEASDQAIQNKATGRPLGEGVLKAGALGAILEGPIGGAAGFLSNGREPVRSNAIDPEILAAGNATLVTPQAPNAAPRKPSQPAPIVPPELGALAANLPPAAPAPANPSIEGAGVAATPNIDWNAAAAALGIDPSELGAAASSLFGDGTTPAPVLDVPRMDAELGAPAPVLDTARIASLLGLPSEQAQQQVAAPEPAAVAPPAKPQAPEVQSEPGLPEPSRFGPLDLRQEIGWSQRGGELVRAAPRDDELNAEQRNGMVARPLGEVIGRTRWTGWPAPDGTESVFWRTRPDRSLTEKQANEALDKFERGEKLRPIEQRFIDHAKATAAEYDRAMQLQEDAERGYSEVERQAALADMRAQHDINVLEADSSEALSLYELSRRAAERGVDDFDIAQAANESNQAYAARLWKLIEEADRGTDTGAAAEDRAGGNQGREGGPQRIQERGFQLAQQPAQEARQADQVAPSAGLFGAPTTRDFIDAAKRGRDAATATGAAVLRNGHLLSAIDTINAAGGDLTAINAAVKARDGAALVRALDDALNAARPAPRVTGLKNAVTDAEREAAGRDPILREAVKSNEAAIYQAMRTVKNDPLAGHEAVARLESAGAEGITLADEAVMLVYKTELMNARDAAAKVLSDTGSSETAKQAARQAWEEAEAKIAAVDAAAVNAGREWGRFGQFRQRMMREDFTLAALERKERARLERPLTAEESATVKAMADKIADLQAKYDALQARMANAESEATYEGLTREMRRQPRHRPSLENLRRAADAARRRLRETQGVPSRRGQSGAIMSPAVFYDYAVIGAYHIANGAARFSDWVAAMRADIGDAWDRIRGEHRNIHEAAKRELKKPIRYDATVAEVLEKIDRANLKPSDVRKLAKAHIGEGLRGEPALIEAMASDLGISADEVRSLFVQSDTQREPTMSEAKQELQNLRKYVALQNEIDRLEAGIPKPQRAVPRPDSPAVAAKKQELADLRKRLRPVRDPEGRYQEMRGKQIQKRIDELRDRIARGDFATKPRVPRALSEANERLAYELDKAKEEFHRHQYLEMLKARSKWGKALGFVGDTLNLSRAVMTGMDLSGLLRQGGFVTFGRPVLGARAFFKTLPALLTEEAQHRIMREIEARPNARLYRKYKLALTGSGGGPMAKVEEAYASRWLDRVALQADQPVRNAIRRARNLALAPTRGSGRVYAAFLSQLRADAFDAMAATMTRTGVPTEAEGKWIADFVNTATGRAKIWGRTDNPGEIVNTLAFAPRLVASRFSLATGTPVWSAPSARAKKLAAMEYARFATGIAVTMSLLAYGLGDDDEAFADHFTFDPRSSDFMKLKFGDTRLDPFTGLSQVMTFTSRLFTGETVNGKGVLKPLRPKWTLTDLRRALGEDIPAHEGITEEGKLGFGARTADSVLGSFLRTKMAPIPGAVVNLLNGTDFKGDPITLAQQARELMLPMSFGDIYDVMQDQGIPRGTAMSVLGLLGMSMQVQTQTDKQAYAEFTDRLKAVRTDVKARLKDLPVDEWQSALDAMKEEYGPALEDVELDYYKEDGEYGAAGEPKRDKNGAPVLKSRRISNPEKYDDGIEGTQTHHIIPDNLARHHPLMAAARKAGYDLDNPGNLISMPDKGKDGEIAHNTSHPKYDAIVFGALNAEQKQLKREYGGMDKVPEGELLEAVRRVEKKVRERLEAKDVPVKDGRLAGTAMGARATA